MVCHILLVNYFHGTISQLLLQSRKQRVKLGNCRSEWEYVYYVTVTGAEEQHSSSFITFYYNSTDQTRSNTPTNRWSLISQQGAYAQTSNYFYNTPGLTHIRAHQTYGETRRTCVTNPGGLVPIKTDDDFSGKLPKPVLLSHKLLIYNSELRVVVFHTHDLSVS